MSYVTITAVLLCMVVLNAASSNHDCCPGSTFSTAACGAIKCQCDRDEPVQNLSPSCKLNVLDYFFNLGCETTNCSKENIEYAMENGSINATNGYTIDDIAKNNCPPPLT
ncbi:uncharacterized protein LOC135490937 [Lineus longissimus]|uniref:uncharacterized protein LOC135490937 n=1 Tax=Lineus longissimus TaxID=88925 RepID=UPI002B4E18E4